MESKQNRREFLKGVAIVGGFSALLIAMPLVPATKWFRKWTGEPEVPKKVIEPVPKSEEYLWQTEKFKNRVIEVKYRDNEVPPPEGMSSMLDPTEGDIYWHGPKDTGGYRLFNGKDWEPYPGKRTGFTAKQIQDASRKSLDHYFKDPPLKKGRITKLMEQVWT